MRLRVNRDDENNVNYIPTVSHFKEVMWTLVKTRYTLLCSLTLLEVSKEKANG